MACEQMRSLDPYEQLKVVLNRDGTLTRLQPLQTVAASENIKERTVISKDITLNTQKRTWVRIFRPSKLPSNDRVAVRLPVSIYFHGGGMIHNGPDTIFCHEFCENFVRFGPAIVVSVAYRLAPENRLPAAYEDGEDALLWLKNQALSPDGQPWLKNYADFSRCFLTGWNSGGNIAYNVRLRSLDMDLAPVKIQGTILDQPLFGGIERTDSEVEFADDQILPLSVTDLIWELALPLDADRDHEYCNPMVRGSHSAKIGSIGRVIVRGYGGDITIDRQMELVQMLVKHGVRVEARFEEVGFHGIDHIDRSRAIETMAIFKQFILGSPNA